ncbi:5-carboxymethyl-2-hydroxymuconate Delta-isomerase [Mesorhizobium xinjiangense]|uniref:5-carboxymethyl-2-hydroxymuconate Delta-isomerase n=1 Tax=Mesorhizobium xinjiangense TaxID=2678685 RepID=UPI0012EEDF4A|nr:5-carboxymethyl-2-hydroxymuconate Delta-isomerase [Mesorhizobium xinjiangense]
MPHLTFEYSANLEDRLDMQALCAETLRAALETGVFETGAVRVRALRADAYAIADGLAENAFLDLSLRIGTGRTLEVKKAAGQSISDAVCAFCAPLFETPHFAFSFEIREIDPELSWRKNAIHPRLRKGRE